MILIGLGANLPTEDGPAELTLAAALPALEDKGLRIVRLSRWYRSSPVPPSGQPDFFNLVAAVDADLDAAETLRRMHAIEERFGRQRSVPNAARTLDLDLLDFHGEIASGWPLLPHPRLHERRFVLMPLKDVAPAWQHPVTGQSIDALLAVPRPDQEVWPVIADTLKK